LAGNAGQQLFPVTAIRIPEIPCYVAEERRNDVAVEAQERPAICYLETAEIVGWVDIVDSGWSLKAGSESALMPSGATRLP
jgi:hypothetical protein